MIKGNKICLKNKERFHPGNIFLFLSNDFDPYTNLVSCYIQFYSVIMIRIITESLKITQNIFKDFLEQMISGQFPEKI